MFTSQQYNYNFDYQQEMKTIAATVEDEKKVIELKYLLSVPNQNHKQELLNILNKLHPFNLYPLTNVPPIQLFETKQQKIVSHNLTQELQTFSIVLVTGTLIICKGNHQHLQNKFIKLEDLAKIHFKSVQGQFKLKAKSNTCYLKIHNIWIEMAIKRQQSQAQEFINKKLLHVPFFANLTFQQFNKCCKSAKLVVLGPGDILLKAGQTPYNMYVVLEGQLTYQRKVKFIKDKQLWNDITHEMQRQAEGQISQQMFKYLVKEPKTNESTFDVIFQVKFANQNDIVCAKQTIEEQSLSYNIISSFKTKLACIKYSDFYQLSPSNMAEIRSWHLFQVNDVALRKQYYYQIKWQEFKQQTKKQQKLNELRKKKLQDFLRKAVDLSQYKYFYCPNKLGQGQLMDSPALQVSKMKQMALKGER